MGRGQPSYGVKITKCQVRISNVSAEHQRLTKLQRTQVSYLPVSHFPVSQPDIELSKPFADEII